MDSLKEALSRRKKHLDHGVKISIELHGEDKSKEEDKEKKMGMAPEVKDSESPVEAKLIPHGSDEKVELGEFNSPEEEDTESPKERLAESAIEDLLGKGMPEEPIGREPNSLHERALAQMKKHPAVAKNTFGKGKK